MRILHVVSNISIRSGVMSVLMNYYRNVDRSTIEFGFMYFDERIETYEEEIKQLGGSVYKVARITSPYSFYKDLDKFCKENYGRYQILHIHEIFMSAFLIGIDKKANIQKIIIHSHVTKFSDRKMAAFRNYLLSQTSGFIANYYFACSKMAGHVVFGRKFDRQGIIVNNAINTDKFRPDRELNHRMKCELGLEGKYVIGHVGNFTPQKNHFFLIDVFEAVAKRNENAVLVLVGDGNLRTAILNTCKNKNIDDKVIFLGTRSDVDRIMHCFDKFLFPSVYEGLGVALIEAQSTGIPCIFSNVVPEEANILKEYNRILSLDESIDNWSSAILEKITVDYNIIEQKMCNSGFCIKNEALKLQELYQKILL